VIVRACCPRITLNLTYGSLKPTSAITKSEVLCTGCLSTAVTISPHISPAQVLHHDVLGCDGGGQIFARRRFVLERGRRLKQPVAHKDRRPHPHRQRDRVARPAVQAEARAIKIDVGVVDLVVDAGDHHAVDVISGLLDQVAQQIVGQRTIGLDPVHFEHDRARLFVTDQNLQRAPARKIPEQHVMRAAIVVEADVGDFDPHLVGRRTKAVAVPRASGA